MTEKKSGEKGPFLAPGNGKEKVCELVYFGFKSRHFPSQEMKESEREN